MMRLLAIVSFCLALLLGIAACENDEPQVHYDPVVVWASYKDEDYLPQLFSDFTTQTGVPVIVVHARPELHVHNLIENIGSQPADVFLTSNITDLVRAADEGALRPIQSKNLEQVASNLRDVDGMWTAINYQQSVIVHQGSLQNGLPTSLYELADSSYKKRLCISSSGLAGNQDIVSMMIADIGGKPAERIVRGWIANIAEAPFKNESELLDAVAAGQCTFAVVTGWGTTALFSNADLNIEMIQPQPGYIQIEGVGVGRHSRYPQSAYLLIDWMLSDAVNKQHARSLLAYPIDDSEHRGVAGQAASTAGWRNDDAKRLMERAGYR